MQFSLCLLFFLPVNLIPLGPWCCCWQELAPGLILPFPLSAFQSTICPSPHTIVDPIFPIQPIRTRALLHHSAWASQAEPSGQHQPFPLGRHAHGWMNIMDTGIFLVPEILPLFAALVIYNHHTELVLTYHLCPVPIQSLKSYLPLNLEQWGASFLQTKKSSTIEPLNLRLEGWHYF